MVEKKKMRHAQSEHLQRLPGEFQMSPQAKSLKTDGYLGFGVGCIYNALANNDARAIRKVHIPKSDVFYVREAIYNRTGEWYTLDHVERAMYLEGMLTKHEVLDPDREREYG